MNEKLIKQRQYMQAKSIRKDIYWNLEYNDNVENRKNE
jgi:hypothetical protein